MHIVKLIQEAVVTYNINICASKMLWCAVFIVLKLMVLEQWYIFHYLVIRIAMPFRFRSQQIM
ncbi:MAG: hypothetical protein CFE23_08110 [Flavobacterium sp. BFFFF1]|nr:MAG: hypothetical protein CFE23_08110 [Flavobacterium sp. BFFFF1]